jgi:hypothetical protein
MGRGGRYDATVKKPARALRHVALVASVALLAPLAGCGSGPARSLSFAQMQSLNPGVHAGWVLEEYPFARPERGPDGRVRTVRLPVTDPQGRPQSVTLAFDANEVLVEKRYSGPIVRPPLQQP